MAGARVCLWRIGWCLPRRSRVAAPKLWSFPGTLKELDPSGLGGGERQRPRTLGQRGCVKMSLPGSAVAQGETSLSPQLETWNPGLNPGGETEFWGPGRMPWSPRSRKQRRGHLAPKRVSSRRPTGGVTGKPRASSQRDSASPLPGRSHPRIFRGHSLGQKASLPS